ncbi:hypothetical protein SDC9_18928 [bioreactor metagenome]|uniref:Uncharacterized protein n=1 Tax=bioreactor metagenome TaxID=1076179 RepID=A0A644U1K7_9ZZZZ
MDRPAIGIEHRLVHHLAQRRMREDGLDQVFLGGLELAADDIALNELGHLGADHVGAQKLAGLRVEDGLHQPLGLAKRNRLAVADEGEAADPDLIARGLRLFLGQTDRGDLRVAIGAAGDRAGLDRMGVLAGDQLGHHHPLVGGLVSKPGRAGDVADRVKPRHAGAAELVDHHMGAIDLHPKRLEPEVLDIADDADGRDHRVELGGGGALRVFEMRGDADARLAVEFLHRGLLEDLHPLLDEGLLGESRNLGVLDRQHPVHHLDHRHIGAERVEEAGEFDADRARTDDQEFLRHPHRHQRVLVGPDQIAIGLEPRQAARTGAGGEDDVLRGQLFHALLGLDRDEAGLGQGGLAHHHGDLVLLQQMRDAARQLLRDPARARDDRVKIIADPLGLQAEFLGAVHQMEDLGRAQQRLGRDAAPVQADAAQMLALDHRDVQPELCAADRRHITPRPRADHDHVEASGSHVSPSAGN